MVQTEVSALGANEHEVRVRLPKEEYDRVRGERLRKLAGEVRLPGFRQGKAPLKVVEKQFAAQLHEETVSDLIQAHYVAAIESSGLTPAVQPALDVPREQPEDAFVFTMRVATWPEVEVKGLKKLKFDRTIVRVEPSDVDEVVERLMASQVRFEPEEGRKAQAGDQVRIDFEGFVDGEAFEGGKGENVALVLGEGRFIPGFEEQLEGATAGEERTLKVRFPEDYQAAHLAGKDAEFRVSVREVARPVKPADEDDLAKMLGFQDAGALRDDIETRLKLEAEQASEAATRQALFEALLAAYPVELPAPLVEEDMRENIKRVIANMRQQGMEVDRSLLQDEAFINEMRARSERGLRISVLLQSIRKQEGIEIDDADVDAEIERRAREYPEAQREQFAQWVRQQPEQLNAIKDAALERKIIAHVLDAAKVGAVEKSLGEWQAEQDSRSGDEA